MNVIDHFNAIRGHISDGNLKEGIDKLQFLSNKSSLLDEIILQKAKLSDLNKLILRGTISYEDETLAKSQINFAMLELIKELEDKILEDDDIKEQLGLSVEEFIRKFGLDSELLKDFSKKSKGRTYKCIWIDDYPEDDEIEMSILVALDIQPLIAKNPYDAYRLIKRENPDILVINSLSRLRDYENEGIEFCEFLYKDVKLRKIPVIIHSISLQNRLKNKEEITFSKNVKNNFEDKNVLVIKDLIEEIIKNIPIRRKKS